MSDTGLTGLPAQDMPQTKTLYGFEDKESQACDLCKREPLEFVKREEGNIKYHLYVDNGSTFSKLTTLIVSYLKAKICALF